MIQMRMRKVDVDGVGYQVAWDSKERRACIKDDARFRDHQTSRVAMFVRVVAGSTENNELHQIHANGMSELINLAAEVAFNQRVYLERPSFAHRL